MFSKKNVKMTAVALVGVMSLGIGSLTATAAEASPFHHGHNYEVQELAGKHHRLPASTTALIRRSIRKVSATRPLLSVP